MDREVYNRAMGMVNTDSKKYEIYTCITPDGSFVFGCSGRILQFL